MLRESSGGDWRAQVWVDVDFRRATEQRVFTAKKPKSPNPRVNRRLQPFDLAWTVDVAPQVTA